MDRIEVLSVFVRLSELGSFSEVAREFGVKQPAISKQINALEAQLNAELVRRTSRSFSLTEAGREFYEAALKVLEAYRSATLAVSESQERPKGLLRIGATPAFARLYITPGLPGFLETYPELDVEIVSAAPLVNLLGAGLDAAVHSGELPDSSMLIKRVGTSKTVIVAAASYLDRMGRPQSPADLSGHSLLSFIWQGGTKEWYFGEDASPVSPRGKLRSNDLEQIRIAVSSGTGIAQVPEWLFVEELRAGTVERVLTAFEKPKPINVVRPGGRRITGKVRAFIEFMEASLHRRLPAST